MNGPAPAGWEIFVPPAHVSSVARQVSVTVTTRGVLLITRPAYQLIGEPPGVDLLFDRDKRLMAFRPRHVGDFSDATYPVRSVDNNPRGSVIVSGMAFIKHHQILAGSTRRWPAEERNGLLVVDINAESLPVARGQRRRRAD